ncbi:CoA transferase [Candidatus Methylomirabilis sp.]|uniref:CaiB/BaiF CoA transferase family protein n=1 Tax=Candidatus Methylomirabilis sp. TaxID=2032687 RepID=UPI002A66D557|nr:CoA transferase [Candidatus Methylomirabilis sp.]
MAGALDGVRVLDLSRHLAGPYCAMMLGDLGAEVIKIERPGVGDESRHWGPPFFGGESAYYLCCNRNKQSLTLNLKHERGLALARELARGSDVVIENFRVGVLDKLGLGYGDLKAINPRLVYCSISGFGHTGPDRDLGSYDFLIQGRSGLMSITGEPDGPPMKVGVAIADVAAGLFASNAVLAALLARERTGVGQHLDIALYDSQVAVLANIASNYLCAGEIPGRWGNAHKSIVPYQTFQAADDYLILAVGNDAQWRQFCEAAGMTAWAQDPRFAANPDRVAHRDVLVPLLQDLLRRKTVAEWLQLCAEADVPAGPINAIDKVFADPQVDARGMLVQMPHPTIGTVRLAGTPLNLSATPAEMRLPPPLLGEHTDAILTRLLGLDGRAIAELHRDGVV